MNLSVKNISKRFGKIIALDKVNLHCSKGEIVGLLGRNGAGKTTLFKILFGLVRADSGQVELERTKHKSLGGIIEKPGLYGYLNAFDNMKVFSRMQGLRLSDKDIELSLQRVGLPTGRTDRVQNYSMGMKQRLGIAIALLNNPSYLVLDEPFSGLDPMGIKAISSLILDVVEKEEIGVLIASHLVDQLSAISDRIYVINNGEIINSGETQKLIREHSTHYTLYASNIGSSESLKNYQAEIFPNKAIIQLPENKLVELLQELQCENIEITSCVPVVNFKKLFDIKA